MLFRSERRNASIEQERRVKENELNTEISVEEKKKQIRETEIATRRMILEKGFFSRTGA